MDVGKRIAEKMKEQGISQNRLSKLAQISQSGLSSIISGQVSPKENTLQAIAKALGCTVSELIGEIAPDIVRMIPHAIPVIGDIACGEPILAEQNIEGYADLPEGVHADFALRCKGDSMTPTFLNGDLVLIRRQPEVENGQIAAVSIGEEATLKHVYVRESGLMLVADNPAYEPILAVPESDKQIIIHGLAVGYIRIFK